MANVTAQTPDVNANRTSAPPSDLNNSTGSTSGYKRAYKACESCRRTKAKCELDASASACLKCVREHRDCVFPPHRSMKRAKLSGDSANDKSAGQLDDLQEANTQTRRSSTANHAACTTLEQRPSSARRSGRHTSFMSEIGVKEHRLSDTPATASGMLPSTQRSLGVSQDSREEDQPLSIQTALSVPSDDLHRDVMQTFVTSSKDAMGLLFRAAEQVDSEDSDEQHNDHSLGYDDGTGAGSIYNVQSPSMPSPGLASTETLDLWDQHRFVRQGWFTAREAVAYIEFFFRNLSPLSPVADSYYADHRNHKRLILEDPLLCCTMLMIASRHHIPIVGNMASRADFIHMRLWRHVEHLIQKITFGSEKYSIGKTRTLGSIQALLLVTEWHPRALHFPPETDGWDSSLAPSVDDAFQTNNRKSDAGRRWREDVFEPAKRSDRMSWMLVGIATTLAHELGVFDHAEDDDNSPEGVSKRRTLLRTRRLLYLYASQLSLRLGCTSVFPQVHQQALTYTPDPTNQQQEQADLDRETMITKWIEITKLLTTATEMFFASPSATRQMLRSSRYVSLLDHFQPLLDRWHKDFMGSSCPTVAEPARQILLVDYHYVRMYINSIAMQALVERASSYNSGDIWLDQDFLRSEFAQDFRFVKVVRDSSTSILSIAAKLAEDNLLHFCPVRLFLRIVSASIFLLKIVSLGSREADVVKSLGQLERCIEALQNSRADDIHLSSRYAMLIARHVRRFKRNFRIKKPGEQHAITLRVNEPATQQGNSGSGLTATNMSIGSEYQQKQQQPQQAQYLTTAISDFNPDKLDSFNPGSTMPFFDFDDDGTMQDWLAQPFNSQIAPFGTDWLQPSTGLAIDSLDFLWNMSA